MQTTFERKIYATEATIGTYSQVITDIESPSYSSSSDIVFWLNFTKMISCLFRCDIFRNTTLSTYLIDHRGDLRVVAYKINLRMSFAVVEDTIFVYAFCDVKATFY